MKASTPVPWLVVHGPVAFRPDAAVLLCRDGRVKPDAAGGAGLGGGGRDLVSYRAPGYVLRVDEEAVDAARFTALTARARTNREPRHRAALLSEALGLWRGPAFAGFRDEPFVREAVARLDEQRLDALEEHAETRLELGEHAAVAAELIGPVGRHPLRERLRAAHMRALYRAGRPSEALDSHHELRRLLAAQLGLDPGPALTGPRRGVPIEEVGDRSRTPGLLARGSCMERVTRIELALRAWESTVLGLLKGF